MDFNETWYIEKLLSLMVVVLDKKGWKNSVRFEIDIENELKKL